MQNHSKEKLETCKEKLESVTQIASSCSVLAGNQYGISYSKPREKVHWLLYKTSDIGSAKK